MAKSYCTFIPSKGQDLFKGLKKQFGYETARRIFYKSINPNFIKDYGKTLSLDAEGIPTLESVLTNDYMKKFIGDVRMIQSIEKEYSEMEDTMQNYNNLLESAYTFNTNSMYRDSYIATVEHTEEGKLKLKINVKDKLSSDKFNDQYSAASLNRRITEIFSPLGLTIGNLSSSEIKAGRIGVTDFSKAREIASGFSSMIRVANNMEGAQAISEEFSHLIVGLFRNESLVDRAINFLSKDEESLRKILGDEYEDVLSFQEGNLELVAEEAVGKLLQKNLLNEVTLNQLNKPSLFRRMINFIVNKFKSFSLDAVDKAIFDANTSMNDLAKTILNGTRQITQEDIINSQREVQFNALSDRIDRNIEILKETAKVEAKRFKISKETKKDKAEALVNELLSYTDEDADTVLGLFNYSKQALSALRMLSTEFNNLDVMTPEQKFKFLRYVRSYVQSYGTFINAMNDAIIDEETEEDDMFTYYEEINGEEVSVKDIVKELNTYSKQLTSKFNKAASSSFVEFLKPFMGEEIEVPFGKYKGSVLSVEQLLKEANNDISFMDRWLDSMADSSDALLQLFDSAVKSAKDKARLETIKSIREIEALRIEAESKGISTFDWMFEKDSEGNLSGNYISKVNQAQFEKDYKDFLEYLDNKYGKNAKGEDAANKIRERTAWLDENAISLFGPPMANPAKYVNKDFLALTKDQLDIYDKFLAIKQKYDKKLPTHRVALMKAVQMRKGSFERFMQSATSPSSIYENIKESIANTFLDRRDDDELFGTTARGLTDFAGKEFMTLPILYTNRLENPNEITTDVFASLMSYAYMANNYEQMDKIIDPLEVGRALVSENRQVRKNRGGNPLVEKFEALEVSVLNKVLHVDGTNIVQKLNDFFDSQVYGKYLKDEGTIFETKINTNKLVSFILKASSTAQLGFNWLANIANVGTGLAMQNIEAAANEFFSASELLSADKTYITEMKDFGLELGKRNKTSKLALFDELFNIKQDYNKAVKANQKKNWLYKIFGENIAFLGQEAGDHWLYNRTAIAMAKRQKVNVPGKGTMSLWDALAIKGDEIKEMYLPEGTTDENGNEFDIAKFSRKIAHVNQHLFGIYNDEDANAANRVAMGRLLMQYRKWMKPQFNKRFQAAQYNVTTGEFEEGYYRTVARMANELIRGQVQLAAQWENMSEHERANVRRALTEIIQFMAVWALANWIEWDDDKDRPWSVKLAEYVTKRLAHELGGLTPSTVMPQELLKTVKTPMASITTVQNLFNLVNSAITPNDYIDEIQSGPYKGLSTFEKHLLKAPIPLIMQYRQIDKFIDDIDTSIQYYARPY